MNTKIALVTGASSGIGYASCLELAQKGFNIIACGRRQERLEELKRELGSSTDILTLNFDVRQKEEVFKAIESIPQNWENIDLLVNNAGNAHGLSQIQDSSMDDWEAMLDINVKGLLYVTKAILPLMIKAKKGHIINIGSIAGREVYGGGAVYCASKQAVDAINKGMRIDLLDDDIKISQIAPGLVETEFSLVRFKGDSDKSKKVYEGYDALQAADVAELVGFIATRPQHVNIADVLVLPSAQATATMVKKTLN